jgi:hypothetical protein
MPRPDEHIHDETLEWGYEATTMGIFCLRALVLSVERGEDEIPIDPQAWENTMTAFEWMLTKHVAGALYTEPPLTQEHLDRARRVHALGSVAISGGQRAPELVPLADACISSIKPDWRPAYATFPVCYPMPEDHPSYHTSRRA